MISIRAAAPVLRVLIAPDCFGESLTAPEAAAAIAAGWRRGRSEDVLITAPQSDGGPGFIDVLVAAQSGILRRHSRVSGPLDGDVDAEWALDPTTSTAYIVCAQACGLALLGGPPTVTSAMAAHSRGSAWAAKSASGAGSRRTIHRPWGNSGRWRTALGERSLAFSSSDPAYSMRVMSGGGRSTADAPTMNAPRRPRVLSNEVRRTCWQLGEMGCMVLFHVLYASVEDGLELRRLRRKCVFGHQMIE